MSCRVVSCRVVTCRSLFAEREREKWKAEQSGLRADFDKVAAPIEMMEKEEGRKEISFLERKRKAAAIAKYEVREGKYIYANFK